jgi:hypothetical protein
MTWLLYSNFVLASQKKLHMNHLILICGYRRSGKDTLYQQLNGNSNIPLGLVYRNPSSKENFAALTNTYAPYQRVSIADEIKRQVKTLLGLPADFDMEANKEKVVGSKTFRQHCIDLALTLRETDPLCWVRTAFTDLKADNVAVTDWRFRNEAKYLTDSYPHVITVRVFRSCVPLPKEDEVCERDLDLVVTDFLIVPSQIEFERACQVFPQYKRFVLH